MGSVHYLPPEQASGKGSTIQSDVYSLGILMYELLSGALPYRGDNPVEIALKHLKDPLPSIKKLMPDLPQSIENVVLKSAAKNPKNRYADAREMHEDLKTCLDESRLDEAAYVYPFQDNDSDLKKPVKKAIPEEESPKAQKDAKGGEEVIAKKITEKDLKKKENKTLLVLGAIFTALVLITTCVVLLAPRIFSGEREAIVPDVSGLSQVEAERMLREAGFTIVEPIRQRASDDIAAGLVVETSPEAGLTRVRGTAVTIFISSGEDRFIMEDFIGRNVIEIQTILRVNHGLAVIIHREEVDDINHVDENQILRQEPSPGTALRAGDRVTFWVPDMTVTIPDFVSGDYSLGSIRTFASRNNITLEEVFQVRAGVEPGTIFSQEPRAGTTVSPGMTLRIFIAEEPPAPPEE